MRVMYEEGKKYGKMTTKRIATHRESVCYCMRLVYDFSSMLFYSSIISLHRFYSISIHNNAQNDMQTHVHTKMYIKYIKKSLLYASYVSRIFGGSCSLELTLKDLIISNKAKHHRRREQQQNCEAQRQHKLKQRCKMRE